MPNENKPISIFLSHSSKDKPFARKLAGDFRKYGIYVWLDEAEILIGDLLTDKLSSAIDEMKYLGVILSPNSIKSKWVHEELKQAMTKEINDRQITVLPFLYRKCNIPEFIADKIYADFRSERNYLMSLHLVLKRFGITPIAEKDDEKFNRLKNTYPLFAIAAEELQISTETAILVSKIPSQDIVDFLFLLIKRVGEQGKYPIAYLALRLIDKYNIGHNIIEYYLDEGLPKENERRWLSMNMQYMSNRKSIVWAHEQMVRKLKNDTYYNSFLQRHLPAIKDKCHDEILTYLLFPDRGPAGYNVDSFALVLKHMKDVRPYQNRWIEWINDGRFDGNDTDESASAQLLYIILNEIDTEHVAFFPIIEAAHRHIYFHLKLGGDFKSGVLHLIAMLRVKYKNAFVVINEILNRVYGDDFTAEQRKLFSKIEVAFGILAQLLSLPDDVAFEKRLKEKISEIDQDFDKLQV